MSKHWEHWTHKGVEYIAVPSGEQGGSVAIMDETGNFYGAFFDVSSFRDRQGKPEAWTPLHQNATLKIGR